MKKSVYVLQSVFVVNCFVDWAIKKDHVAIVEAEPKTNKCLQSDKHVNFGLAEEKSEVKSIGYVKSALKLNFASVKEFLDKIKTFTDEIQSGCCFNVFLESGAPHLLLHQFIENGFTVHIVDGKQVNDFRGDKKKTDKNDAEYIQQLYHKNPTLFHQISDPEKKEIEIRFKMDKYNHFTKDLARFKNRQKAYEHQFGENSAYKTIIAELKTKKKNALKDVVPLIKDELEQINIKGIGKTLLAQLLSAAHPKRFPSQSRYLAYCGYTANRRYKDPKKGYVKNNLSKKHNRIAHMTAYLMAKSCIMHKNPKWYPFYKKVKEQMKQKLPKASKIKINNKAINRLATFLLKEIYGKLKEESVAVIKSL